MKAYDFLTDETWTQGCGARDYNDKPVKIDSPTAVKWCAIGAIVRCYCKTPELLGKMLGRLERKVGKIKDWNDKSKQTFHKVQQTLTELGI